MLLFTDIGYDIFTPLIHEANSFIISEKVFSSTNQISLSLLHTTTFQSGNHGYTEAPVPASTNRCSSS